MHNPVSLREYFCHDLDTASDPQYFGFVRKDGFWFIMEYNVASGTIRFIGGEGTYTTNWTGRAALSYNYIYAAGVDL